jgi:hypothetical protein
MNATTEFVATEELTIETTDDAMQIELSLSELDMVGGGTMIASWE